MTENKAVYIGTGRRKNAVARVRLTPGTGVMTVNKKPAAEYFGREALVAFASTPFKVTETVGRFDALNEWSYPLSLSRYLNVRPFALARYSMYGETAVGVLSAVTPPGSPIG